MVARIVMPAKIVNTVSTAPRMAVHVEYVSDGKSSIELPR
jgi:hypothetical protein